MKQKNESNSREFIDDLEYTLADTREIHIYGHIEGLTAGSINTRLCYLRAKSRKPVTIYLNSPGGDVYSGLAMYDSIKNAGVPVTVITTGMCMSMAVIVLQASKVRKATRNTSFLLHEISGVAIGTLSAMGDRQREAERLENRITGIISRRSGITPKKLKSLFKRKDLFMDAETALKHGLIDEITDGGEE